MNRLNPQPPSTTGTGTGFLSPKIKAGGFLHIVRHGTGSGTMYVVTYHRLQREARVVLAQPALAESAQLLIDMLERLGVDFRLREVRGALEDVLRLGSANIPDLWINDEEIARKSLLES
jgi:hypothetical protein